MRAILFLVCLMFSLGCMQPERRTYEGDIHTNERMKKLVMAHLSSFDMYSMNPKDSVFFNRIAAVKKDFLNLYENIDSFGDYFTDSILSYREKYLPKEKMTVYSYSENPKIELCLSSLEILKYFEQIYISSFSLIKEIKPQVRQTTDSVFISICVAKLDDYNVDFFMADYDTIEKKMVDYDDSTVKYQFSDGVLKFKRSSLTRPKSAVVKTQSLRGYNYYMLNIK